MSYGNDSTELVKVGISLTVFAGFVAIVLGRTCYACEEDHRAVMKSAARFQEETGVEGKITCQDVDSDGDGYVTCTLVKPDGTLVSLDCAGSLTYNKGCRVTVARVIKK